jgi:hypothetical protein
VEQALLILLCGLCLLGAAVASLAPSRLNASILRLGAVLLLVGAALLAVFVFSGDPYVDDVTSRWSRRSSHLFVYAAWIVATALAAALWVMSKHTIARWTVAGAMCAAAAGVLLEAVAAVSQDLN